MSSITLFVVIVAVLCIFYNPGKVLAVITLLLIAGGNPPAPPDQRGGPPHGGDRPGHDRGRQVRCGTSGPEGYGVRGPGPGRCSHQKQACFV